MSPQTHPSSIKRLVIHDLTGGGSANTFAEDVRTGLTASPKYLLPKYFYDELGSLLFESVCFTPEYYLTRSETEILTTFAGEIIELASVGYGAQPPRTRGATATKARLIELGSGSAVKTRYLIEALLARQDALHYLPVDISTETLRRSSEELLQSYPGLRITAGAGEYFTVMRAMQGTDPGGNATVARDAANASETLGDRCLRDRADRSIVLFLGSNIGNFDPDESHSFLRETRKLMKRGDTLLLGADLKKDSSVLEPAYNDALGITSAFNRNLLVRINRELGGDFDITKFEHRAVYNKQKSRIEMYLVSLEQQTVRIRELGLDIRFDRGESIPTENSYKFDLEDLSQLAAGSGFVLVKTWIDHAARFSFNMLAAEYDM